MTLGFHRSRSGIVADLAEAEMEILLGLVTQTQALLEDATGGPTPVEGNDGDSFETMMRRAGFVPDGPQDDARPMPMSDDPAVQRLLPDGHHDDPELAAEFRRLTGATVRDRKLDHLRRAVHLLSAASTGRLRLTEEEARSLLIAMNDVRLVLAERLDLDDDEAAEALSDQIADMAQDDPRFALALGYEFLTWLQETLAVAMAP